MGPNQWQQRRTGKVRRRLQYTSFIFISTIDCNCQGDLPQSSGEKAALSYVNDAVALSKGSLALDTLGIGHKVASTNVGSLSERTLECAGEACFLCSETKESWGSSAADVADLGKSFQNEKCWSSTTQDSERLSISHGEIDVSLEQPVKQAESIKSEEPEQRRGTRKRRPKLPFEEMTVEQKSQKKHRRIRIMRYLGLAAPYGSPFISKYGARTS